MEILERLAVGKDVDAHERALLEEATIDNMRNLFSVRGVHLVGDPVFGRIERALFLRSDFDQRLTVWNTEGGIILDLVVRSYFSSPGWPGRIEWIDGLHDLGRASALGIIECRVVLESLHRERPRRLEAVFSLKVRSTREPCETVVKLRVNWPGVNEIKCEMTDDGCVYVRLPRREGIGEDTLCLKMELLDRYGAVIGYGSVHNFRCPTDVATLYGTGTSDPWKGAISMTWTGAHEGATMARFTGNCEATARDPTADVYWSGELVVPIGRRVHKQ